MTKTLEKIPKAQKPEQSKSDNNFSVERVSDMFTRQSPDRHEAHGRAVKLMRGLGFSALRNIIKEAPDRLSNAKSTVQEHAKKVKDFGVERYQKIKDHAVDKMQARHAELSEKKAYKEKAFRERPAFDSPTFDAERWAELGRKNALGLELDAQNERATDYLLSGEAKTLRQDINRGYSNPETIPTYPKPAVSRTLGGIALKLFQPGRIGKKD